MAFISKTVEALLLEVLESTDSMTWLSCRYLLPTETIGVTKGVPKYFRMQNLVHWCSLLNTQ